MEAVCERHPSVVVRLTSQTETIWGHSCGFADEQAGTVPTGATAYRIGSLTKTFTALATLKLRDQHRLRLTAALRTSLPTKCRRACGRNHDRAAAFAYFRIAPPWAPRVLARGSAPKRADVLQALRAVVMRSADEPPYLYSNLGYAVLGLVVESAAQRPFRDYLVAEVLRPMGLDRTRWDCEA